MKQLDKYLEETTAEVAYDERLDVISTHKAHFLTAAHIHTMSGVSEADANEQMMQSFGSTETFALLNALVEREKPVSRKVMHRLIRQQELMAILGFSITALYVAACPDNINGWSGTFLAYLFSGICLSCLTYVPMYWATLTLSHHSSFRTWYQNSHMLFFCVVQSLNSTLIWNSIKSPVAQNYAVNGSAEPLWKDFISTMLVYLAMWFFSGMTASSFHTRSLIANWKFKDI